MVKTAELSIEVRASIVARFNSGVSIKQICRELNLLRQTVHYQINKHKRTNSVQNLPRKGKKRKTTLKEDRHILREFTKNPALTPKSLELEMKSLQKSSVSERTIRRRLKEYNFGTYTVRKIPFISPKNKLKRFKFAREYVNKPLSFWNKVLWTDESSFEFHGSPKKKSFRWQTISRGGGSVMFWGCISASGHGDLVPIDGSMNQSKYLDVLNENAFPSGDRLIGNSFIFQQDNAPCHKSKMITKFLNDIGLETLNWPPQSPDLNVIENVWAYIKGKRNSSLSRRRDETIFEVKTLWEEIPQEMLQKLVESVPRRLQKVIDAKGGYIFY